MQALVCEGLNTIFAKHGRPEIAHIPTRGGSESGRDRHCVLRASASRNLGRPGGSGGPRVFAVGFEQRIRQGNPPQPLPPGGKGPTMTCPSRLAAGSVGVAVLLIGSLAAAQLPSAEQRAFAGVDSAVARFNGAGDRNEMVRAAGQVLDAAESALNAFAAADRARDAANARFNAAVRVIPTCNNGGFRCNADGTETIGYYDGLEDAYTRTNDAQSALSAANASYLEVVGMPGAEARERAARYRRIANRHRGSLP